MEGFKFKTTTKVLNTLSSAMREENWLLFSRILECEYKILRKEVTAEPIFYEYNEQHVNLFKNLLTSLILNTPSPSTKALTVVFKSLRNYCLHHRTQEAVLQDEHILQITNNILTKFINEEYSAELYFLRFILEFLTNMCISLKLKKVILYKILVKNLSSCIKHSQFSYNGCALLYNLLLDTENEVNPELEIYETVLNQFTEKHEDNEYLELLVVYTFLPRQNFWRVYDNLCIEHRMIILNIIKQQYIIDNNSEVIPVDCFIKFSASFQIRADCILKTVNEYVDNLENVWEVVLLLEILASFGSKNEYLETMQKDSALLITCCNLLKSIHELGKLLKNNFTPLGKLSEITQPTEDIEQHPAFGFKANLIRIIGIFVYQHTINQDKIREMSMLPLILDCCNLDARNPVIMQWCILTIRNLCQKNEDNQKIIAELSEIRKVQSETLEEMGITLHADDKNEIKVVPYDSLKQKR